MNNDNQKQNAKMRTSSGMLVQAAAVAVLVCGIFFACIAALINGFLEGSPPTSDHNKKAPVHKTENVAVTTDSNGAAEEVEDNVYITNNPEHKILVDKTLLTSITNKKQKSNLPEKLKGDKIKWSAKGYDVSYNGVAQPSDLPITMSVKYYLNGKEIDADDLIGKSGKLKIVVNYDNNIDTTLEDGTEIIVPYVVSTILVSSKDFSKIKCTTGKCLNMGGNEIAIGVNVPGLDSLSGSTLFGVGTSETIFTGKISNFQGAQIKSFVTGDILSELDAAKLGKLDVDALVVKLATTASGAISTINKYEPYLDKVNEYVPKVMDISGKARSTTNTVTSKIIEFLEQLNTNFNTVAGVTDIYSDIIEDIYSDLYGTDDASNEESSGEAESSESTSGQSVNDTLEEFNKAIIGDDKDNPIIVENLEQLAEYIKENIAELETEEQTETEEYSSLKTRLNEIYVSIAELDPTSEVLPEDIKEQYSGKTGLLEKYDESVNTLNKYEEIYSDPKFVEEYFKTARAELEEAIATTTDEEELAKLKDQLDTLDIFEKKCIKEDGTYYSLKEIGEMGVSAKEIISYIIESNITPEQKEAIITKLESANGFVNKIDDMIQKYGKKAPGLIKKLKQLKKKIDKLYYKKFLKYLGIYNEELKGTLPALQKTIEGHQRVQNFSGLPDGWTGTTTYTFTVPVGTDSNLIQLLDIRGIIDGKTETD